MKHACLHTHSDRSVMVQAMVYIHRIHNSLGMHDVLLDNNLDIADCRQLFVVQRGKQFYCLVRLFFDNKLYYLHTMMVPDVPDGFMIDHINGNGLDNTRCNLRIVNKSQNSLNSYRSNSTGFAGVHQRGDRFQARVKVNGISKAIGTFAHVEEAAMMRDEVVEVLNAGFSRPNFEKHEHCLNDGHMRQIAAFFNEHNIQV